jgi:hypothetical protein
MRRRVRGWETSRALFDQYDRSPAHTSPLRENGRPSFHE